MKLIIEDETKAKELWEELRRITAIYPYEGFFKARNVCTKRKKGIEFEISKTLYEHVYEFLSNEFRDEIDLIIFERNLRKI